MGRLSGEQIPVPGVENRLAESMWQQGQRGENGDCMFYLKTGRCKFGVKCRFNHPSDQKAVVEAILARQNNNYPQRVDQPNCQYYMRTRICKYGFNCKFHHPKIGSSMKFNIYGFPMRKGEPECDFFLKTGDCRFGVSCKFHHPQPTSLLDKVLPAQQLGVLYLVPGYGVVQHTHGSVTIPMSVPYLAPIILVDPTSPDASDSTGPVDTMQ